MNDDWCQHLVDLSALLELQASLLNYSVQTLSPRHHRLAATFFQSESSNSLFGLYFNRARKDQLAKLCQPAVMSMSWLHSKPTRHQGGVKISQRPVLSANLWHNTSLSFEFQSSKRPGRLRTFHVKSLSSRPQFYWNTNQMLSWMTQIRRKLRQVCGV